LHFVTKPMHPAHSADRRTPTSLLKPGVDSLIGSAGTRLLSFCQRKRNTSAVRSHDEQFNFVVRIVSRHEHEALANASFCERRVVMNGKRALDIAETMGFLPDHHRQGDSRGNIRAIVVSKHTAANRVQSRHDSSLSRDGERKANMLFSPSMASRRPSEEIDRPLTEAQLANLRRRLAMLHSSSVADAYRRAHEASRMDDGDRLPRASAVQELVAAWKVLWKWRKR